MKNIFVEKNKIKFWGILIAKMGYH